MVIMGTREKKEENKNKSFFIHDETDSIQLAARGSSFGESLNLLNARFNVYDEADMEEKEYVEAKNMFSFLL